MGDDEPYCCTDEGICGAEHWAEKVAALEAQNEALIDFMECEGYTNIREIYEKALARASDKGRDG